MALRAGGVGEIPGIITEAFPCQQYRATTPEVGDSVRAFVSGALNLCINSTAAGQSILHTTPYPIGIVKNVSKDSRVCTVEWINVKQVRTFEYSGTATRGLAIQHCNAARSNKWSCIATAAAVAKPWVVAVDVPASGQLTAFIL